MENKDVLIFGSVDPETIKDFQEYAERHGKRLVHLDDKVIVDYLEGQEQASKTTSAVTIESFLSDEGNKKETETKALALFNLITHNGDIKTANERIFTKSEIVKRTNLTNRTLGELLDLFNLFGLVEFTRGSYEFKFTFDDEIKAGTALVDVTNTLAMLAQNIGRYLALIPEEERETKRTEVRSLIEKLKL